MLLYKGKFSHSVAGLIKFLKTWWSLVWLSSFWRADKIELNHEQTLEKNVILSGFFGFSNQVTCICRPSQVRIVPDIATTIMPSKATIAYLQLKQGYWNGPNLGLMIHATRTLILKLSSEKKKSLPCDLKKISYVASRVGASGYARM